MNTEGQMEFRISGDQLRDEGVDRIAEHYPDWLEVAILEIQKIANKNENFTADDIRHLPLPHMNCAGAAFRIASQRKLIKPNGYTPAQTASCHSRVIRVWTKA